MPISTGTPQFSVDSNCANCGQCCGGTCVQYKACRQACYPCCTDNVLFQANLDLPVLTPLARDAEGKYGAYDPNSTVMNYAEAIAMHPIFTDANGRLTNFRSVMSWIPACGEYSGVVWTSGEFLESQIAGGDAFILGALLSQPSFAKRIPNGYIRIL